MAFCRTFASLLLSITIVLAPAAHAAGITVHDARNREVTAVSYTHLTLPTKRIV